MDGPSASSHQRSTYYRFFKPTKYAATLHFVTVTGFDENDDVVLVNDPAGQKLQKMARADFERQWASADHWTLLCSSAIARCGFTTALALLLLQSPELEKNRALELAGIGFRAGNYVDAQRHIRRVLRSEPSNAYANNFLAITYLLQGTPKRH